MKTAILIVTICIALLQIVCAQYHKKDFDKGCQEKACDFELRLDPLQDYALCSVNFLERRFDKNDPCDHYYAYIGGCCPITHDCTFLYSVDPWASKGDGICYRLTDDELERKIKRHASKNLTLTIKATTTSTATTTPTTVTTTPAQNTTLPSTVSTKPTEAPKPYAHCLVEAFPIGIVTDINECDMMPMRDCEISYKFGFEGSSNSHVDSDAQKHWHSKYKSGFICDEFDQYGSKSSAIDSTFTTKTERTGQPCPKIKQNSNFNKLHVQVWEDDWDPQNEINWFDDLLLDEVFELPYAFTSGEEEYVLIYKKTHNTEEGGYLKTAFVVRHVCNP